jgi:type I restriction-modification system DNA methylase subunit
MLDDIKKTLCATADQLRANMDAAEYKHLVLGLIFVKYISDTFAASRAELKLRLQDETDEYFYGKATRGSGLTALPVAPADKTWLSGRPSAPRNFKGSQAR